VYYILRSLYIILDITRLLATQILLLNLILGCVFLATSKMNKSYPTVFLHMKYSSELPQQIVPYDHTKQYCCGKKSQRRNNNCSIAFCAVLSTLSYCIVIPKVPPIFVISNYFRWVLFHCCSLYEQVNTNLTFDVTWLPIFPLFLTIYHKIDGRNNARHHDQV
jgi:hypothetical protein